MCQSIIPLFYNNNSIYLNEKTKSEEFQFVLKLVAMRFVSVILFSSISIGVFGQISAEDPVVAGPIQIVTPVNHTLHLELDNLKRILEADNVKDRHVVVLSIAGAFRKGKSFLLNFFVRYLYAQVYKHCLNSIA